MITRLREAFAGMGALAELEPSGHFRHGSRKRLWILAGIVSAVFIGIELRTSWIQAHLLSDWIRPAGYQVTPGEANDSFRAGTGPYDERLGYSRLNSFLARLKKSGYEVEAQARWSGRLKQLVRIGTFPIYREKAQAGLMLVDRKGEVFQDFRWPERLYPDFDSIPPLVAKSLIYIENREILDTGTVHRNPALEWDRLGRAVLDLGLRQVSRTHPASGGSTLATQLEKLRHSPGGRTGSVAEKARQIATASLRAYLEGPMTMDRRKGIVRDYINSAPLAATPAHGEVIGLGDALFDFYGARFDHVNRLLRDGEPDTPERAQAYRQALSLLLAINRPSYYLRQNPDALKERTDSYLRLLAHEGIISEPLRDLALRADATPRPAESTTAADINARKKSMDAVRYRLLPLLGVPAVYELDRLDLRVNTTLDNAASRIAAEILERLSNPQYAAEAGIFGDRLLAPGQGSPVVYSFTLYERGADTNRLLVQVDSARQALNLNEGSKLELGSTAKLRTLAAYLEVIADLHAQLTRGRLEGVSRWKEPDRLTNWALEFMEASADKSLGAMLEAAMNRAYSASPAESFFTGGGVHVFANFDGKDNGQILTVREALQRSVNLVFIRLLRDLTDYYSRRTPDYSPTLFTDENDPARMKFLKRFADKEGSSFLRDFYEKYEGQNAAEVFDTLLATRHLTPVRFSVLDRTLRPQASLEEFGKALRGAVNEPLTDKRVQDLYTTYTPGKFDWNDLGYLAGIHPLELWLADELTRNPETTWEQARDASRDVRQQVYQWLFKSRHKHAQDLRIRTVLEADAFAEIHKVWKRHGYPFRKLVPSLATAIGSSGDTPAALAEFAGIVLSGGLRYPSLRIEKLHFGEGTPFETVAGRRKRDPVRVMPKEVAARLHQEMLGVVEKGTARRAYQSAVLSDRTVLPVGGKTGTGDNRDKTPAGQGRVRNRTATFVFTVGERYFGTVVAYVPGDDASGYRFTSSLPVQVFKKLIAGLLPALESGVQNPPSRLAGNIASGQNHNRVAVEAAALAR